MSETWRANIVRILAMRATLARNFSSFLALLSSSFSSTESTGGKTSWMLENSWCFLGFYSWGVTSAGHGSGLGRPVWILYESTVKATINTYCEVLAGLSGDEAGE